MCTLGKYIRSLSESYVCDLFFCEKITLNLKLSFQVYARLQVAKSELSIYEKVMECTMQESSADIHMLL